MEKITIITARSGFPNGSGASSILRKYGEGFKKLGYDIDILLLRPSETVRGNQINSEIEGVYKGISFKYMCKTTITKNNYLKRIYLYFIGVLNTLIYLLKNHNKLCEVFFYSPDYIISTMIIQLLCKNLNINCIGIKTESSYSDKQRTKKLFWKYKEKLIYKNFNSMIVISEYLKKQIKDFGYNGNIEVIPIVVNENMYDYVNVDDKLKEIIYMGSLAHKKELKLLIKSFSIVNKRFENWSLKIIGSFNSKELKTYINNYINELELDNHIKFLGFVSANDLPELLAKGGIMVLPRVRQEYSEAGFPIKLGEYLLSGSPTIVTKTGEINKYLIDGKNSFLVEKINAKNFAKKIIYVINNYNYALEIGNNGRKLSIKEFGSKNICKKMLSI